MTVAAIIPARGGSKGIPRKNLLPLGDVPLIAYSIASALAAHSISRVIVSTDDAEIATIARAWGAEVPFMRPANLATDDAPDYPLFEHALHWMADHEGYHPEVVVQLRPTTPLRPRGMLDSAINMLVEDPCADCVRGMTRPNQNPYKMWRLADDVRYVTPLLDTELPEPYNVPRQNLPMVLWQTGHVDVFRSRTLREARSITGERVRHVLIDPRYCVDIDTAKDFEYAAWLLKTGGLDIDVPALA